MFLLNGQVKVDLRPSGLPVVACLYSGSKYRYYNEKEGHNHHNYNALIYGLSHHR